MNIFTNPEEHRLRAGWRLATQLFLMFLLLLLILLAFSAVLPISSTLPYVIAMAISSVISVVIAVNGLDQRPFNSLGLSFTAASLPTYLVGFFLAGGVMGILFAIEYLFGWVSVSGFGWQFYHGSFAISFISYFLLMVLVGFYEELVFRAYAITNVSEGLHLSVLNREQAVISAVVLSALIFGLMHAPNAGASFVSVINIALAGAMLAFPYIITGRLSLSVGLHIGWNFFQGGIFGFPVSGSPNTASILRVQQYGNTYITGGAFGPEAGLMGFAGILGVVIGLYFWFKVHHHPLHIAPRFGIYPYKESEQSL